MSLLNESGNAGTGDNSGATKFLNAKVRIISAFDDMEQLDHVWNDLVDNSLYPNAFALFEWQTAWWRAFNDRKVLYIIVVFQGDKVIGLLPLYRVSRWPRIRHGTILRLIGNGASVYPDYLGLIVRTGYLEPVCQAITHHFRSADKCWTTVLFEDVADDDPGTRQLVATLRTIGPYVEVPRESRLYLLLPRSYDEFLQQLSGHNRRKKKNRLRQAYNKYGAEFKEMCYSEIGEWFPQLVRLTDKARLERSCGPSLATSTRSYFHREVLQGLMPSQRARVFFLRLNNQLAAFWYVLSLHGKVYAYQSASDTDQPGSPGDIALQLTISRVIDEGHKEFDFLAGAHWYKSAYTSTSRKTYTVYQFRRFGCAFLARQSIENLARPMKRILSRIVRLGHANGHTCWVH